jgi:putative peptide zinc metalloprotease protein
MSEQMPKLRGDLKISRHVQKDGVHFVIKDPLTQEYFRFPADEYDVIKLFDGTTTLAGISQKYNQQHAEVEIDESTTQQFYDTLEKNHLIEKKLAEQNLFLLERLRQQRKSALLGAKGGITYFRISLLDPDRLLTKTYPYLKWIFSPQFLIGAGIFILCAALIVAQSYERFADSMASIITFKDMTPAAFAALWVTVVIVIFFHELGHAFTCKHFGGEVHEMGVLMLFFTPCFFANVNDAWTFEKRYQKLAVTFAGGLVELFIGACATFVWFVLNPASPASAIMYQIMTICAVSALVCNFNPLMKLDGYYAFCDWVGIPNLKAESPRYLKYLLSRYVFRLETDDDVAGRYSPREKRLLFGYSVASFFYMIGVMIGMFMMLRNLAISSFGAIGVFVSLWLAWKLFKGYAMKLWGFGVKLFKARWERISRHPVIATSLAVILSGLLIYGFSTHALKVEKPCELLAISTTKVFSPFSGFLVQNRLAPGARVLAGEVVGILDNPDDAEKLEQLEIRRIQQSNAHRQALAANDYAASREAEYERTRIEGEIADLRDDLAACSLRVPIDGTILVTGSQKGYQPFFAKGAELCTVAPLDSFRIELTLMESELGDVVVGDHADIRLAAAPAGIFKGTIRSIDPVSVSYVDKSKERGGVENMFKVQLALLNSQAMHLMPSMSGSVRIHAGTMRGFRLIARGLHRGLRSDLFF